MANPRINEEMMLQVVDPENSVPVGVLRIFLQGAVVDCLDRKVAREFAGDVIEKAFDIFGALERLEFSVHMQKLMVEAGAEGKVLGEAVNKLAKQVEANRYSLLELLKKLTQCPYDGDTKH